MISGEWTNIVPWSTEAPNLYVVKLELKNPEGKIVQTRETRIGFRTVEFFPQDGVYLNGTKLVIKGINRHSFSVDGGRTTNAALSRMDAQLIKEMNMNAVRSHYPPDEHFLDMCDSLGLVYMDELAGWQNSYDSKVGAKLVKEMIERMLTIHASSFGATEMKVAGIRKPILYLPNMTGCKSVTWCIPGLTLMNWIPTTTLLI